MMADDSATAASLGVAEAALPGLITEAGGVENVRRLALLFNRLNQALRELDSRNQVLQRQGSEKKRESA